MNTRGQSGTEGSGAPYLPDSSQSSFRVRNLNSQKKPTVASMRQMAQKKAQEGGGQPTSVSQMLAAKLGQQSQQPTPASLNSKGTPHELSKESLFKPPRIQPLGAKQQQSQPSLGVSRTAAKSTAGSKPFNRLVPVPPPKGFMMNTIVEEEKKEGRPQKKVAIQSNQGVRQSVATSLGKRDGQNIGGAQSQASPQMSIQSSKLNKTRASTAKSTTSFYSARQSQSEFYLAEKRAGRVKDDDTLSVAEKSMVESALTQQNVLFSPNEIVEDNGMVAMIVKQNTMLLQRCLKSKSKDLYFAAIDSLVGASDNFGPALNKHLPVLLPLVAKRQDLANDERIQTLKDALCFNGGDEAEQMLQLFPLK